MYIQSCDKAYGNVIMYSVCNTRNSWDVGTSNCIVMSGQSTCTPMQTADISQCAEDASDKLPYLLTKKCLILTMNNKLLTDVMLQFLVMLRSLRTVIVQKYLQASNSAVFGIFSRFC